MKTALIAIALVVAAAAWLLARRDVAQPPLPAEATPVEHEVEAPAPALAAPTGEREALAAEPAAEELDLFAALHELARLDLSDEARLNALVHPLLIDPSRAREALQLLVSGALKTHADVLSPGEVGAIRLVWLAVGAYAGGALADELAAAGQHVDPRGFTEEVLRALALIEEPAASTLARLVAGLEVAGRQVVDASYEELLRVLAATYPDRAELWAIFLGLIGHDEPLEYDLAFLRADEDPDVLRQRLVAAFGKADPAEALQLLQWAEETFAGGSEELQLALAAAVAQAAPVSLAAGFLAARATPYMLGPFDTLGGREGALEALTGEYNRLLIEGATDRERTMIVSGLAGSGVETLLGLASSDPSPKVRGQALVSATAAPDFTPSAAFLETLRAGHQTSGPHSGAPTYATITAARHLLRESKAAGQAELAAQTIDFLRELALDPAVSSTDRSKIPGILEGHLSSAEWDAFTAAVSAVGPK